MPRWWERAGGQKMKLDLKEFQTEKCRELLEELAAARDEFSRRGRLQALVFSSPTGSGKTIAIAALIEQHFRGTEGHLARPDTRVLWISDSPELNVQSRDKLLRACDGIAFHDLVMVDANYDTEFLPSGKVHFINTQLLGKDKKLTQQGDGRSWTFWQTVQNTIRDYGENFLLIIDEAHRGMGVTTIERNRRKTIIRKFIDGAADDGLQAVPLVLGMSATTQRFDEYLAQTEQPRTTRKVVISPAEVQESGLLKDTLIVANPEGPIDGDITLLSIAGQQWNTFDKLWSEYCAKEGEPIVRPILVVQIEDGIPEKNILTKTNLDEAIEVLKRTIGPFSHGALVHCFQETGSITAGGEDIRRVDASRIQDDEVARVVFFKMALSTGWDCPRAEVMMSFRRAVDSTHIAQLVGRMIRTPLARRIESDEVLNTVHLYLPHYDRESLGKIVEDLRNPDAEDRPPTNVETATCTYERNPSMKRAFKRLYGLPNYSISNLRPLPPVKRLLRYASLLSIKDRIAEDAYFKARDAIVDLLVAARDNKAATQKDWSTVVAEGGELAVSVSSIDLAEIGLPEQPASVQVKLTPENIHRLFASCGHVIAAGEGLENAFWKKAHDPLDPDRAKIELYVIVRDSNVLKFLETFAVKRFKELRNANRSAISKLPEANRQCYRTIENRSGSPEVHDWGLPDRIVERNVGDKWQKHLYCNEEDAFQCKFNTWEQATLEAEMRRIDFVGWLRNRERAPWALCIPYEHGGVKGFFPDFLILRKEGKSLVVDLLEPHDPSRTDTYAKAKGLAKYAKDHGERLGRLMIIKAEGSQAPYALSAFDVNDPDTREKVLKLKGNSELAGLYLPMHPVE